MESQIRQATIPPNFPKQFADQYLAGREGFIAVPAATGNSTLRRRYERPLLAILVVVALVLRHGRDFQSFHVKDPDGFDLQISNGNRKNRRQGSANGKTSAPAPFEASNWKTVWLDHISFEVSNYKETVAFYTALLGWKPGTDEGSQNQCEIGDVGGIIIRRGNRGNRGGGAGTVPAARGATIGHIAFGITPFDPDQVKAELEKRALTARVDTGGRGDIHTASYKSYHTTTPNGFDLQISATTRANRES